MKTLRLNIRTFYILWMSMFIVVWSTTFIKAQSGHNDATFNEFDDVSGQGANLPVTVSALQPDNKIVIAGNFTSYNGVAANGLARLAMDGKPDESFDAGMGVSGVINSIAIQPNNRIIVAGAFSTYNGELYNSIARLKSNGDLDTTFSPGDGPNDAISQVLIQPNGKILVAGSFTQYNGTAVHGLVRLNNNGSVDSSFEAVIPDSLITVQQIGLQTDGKIIVAGLEVNEWIYNAYSVIRLNSDGTRDYSFNKAGLYTGDLHPAVNAVRVESDGNILLSITIYDAGSSVPYHGILSRLDTDGNTLAMFGTFWMNSLLIQDDGKIIAAGFDDLDFYDLEKRVVRFNTDLTIDSTFQFEDNKVYPERTGVSIETAALQIDGKIVLAGDFYELNGLIVNNVARLNSNGTFDHTFNQHTGFNGTVLATAVHTKRRLIVGGDFSRFNYLFRSNILRLTEDGELDPSFNVGTGTNGKVNSIAVQSNGRVLIGGSFTSYNGNLCSNIARLKKDGSYDAGFSEVTTDGVVRKIIIDKDGRIIIAGDFENVNGVPMRAIARIKPNGTLDNTFNSSVDAYGRGYDCRISSRGKIYLAVVYQDGNYTFGTDIFCLNKNGTRDESFHIETDDFYSIYTLAFNNDNKLLAGGLGEYSSTFQKYAGVVAQFNADGSFDSTLDYHSTESVLNGSVRAIHVLENDRMIIGGEFSANDASSINYIGMLNSDGSVSEEFDARAGNRVYSLTPVRNDKLIVGGSFSEYAGVVRNGIARVDVGDIADEPGGKTDIAVRPDDSLLLNVYPNPATSAVIIDNLIPGSTFKIFNAMGTEVYSEVVSMKKTAFQLDKYSNGIYFIVSENLGNKSASKLIVNK
jgi:uncharacterized delta-60 repeat protein